MTFVKWYHYFFILLFVRKSFNFIDIKSVSWVINLEWVAGCQNKLEFSIAIELGNYLYNIVKTK